MKFTEAWRLSKYAYKEVAYRSIEMSRGASSGSLLPGQNPRKMFERVMGSVKISKSAFAVFGTIGAAFPFAEYFISPTPEALVSGISLSLAISLAYIVFFSLQILPSLSSGEPYVILRTLPLEKADFSLVSTLSFIRTFDYIAVTTSVVQVTAVALLTHSALATVMMAVGAATNVIFAMAIALWFSGVFYRNVTRGGRSRGARIWRALLLVSWGVATMSIGFMFNLVSFVLPFFSGAVLGTISQPGGLVLIGLHPFSISLAITNVVYPTLYNGSAGAVVLFDPRFFSPLLSFLAAFGYVGLAIIVGRRTLRSVSNITLGSNAQIIRETAKDYSLKLSRPLRAYVAKDLKLAAKNPSMAVFYAAPAFEVIMLYLITFQFPVMRASSMIVSTVIGCFFAIMFCSTLLNTEGAGLEYTFSLPIRPRIIVTAKSLLSSIAYLPAPFALLLIGLSKHVTSGYNLLIPFVEIIAVVAACVAEIAYFVKPTNSSSLSSIKSRARAQGFSIMAGSDVKLLMKALAISCVILVTPLFAYSFSYLVSMSHASAIITMAAVACVELGIVLGIVQRLIG